MIYKTRCLIGEMLPLGDALPKYICKPLKKHHINSTSIITVKTLEQVKFRW